MFFAISAVPGFGQQPPDSRVNQIEQIIATGTAEAKRDALFAIRNIRSEYASRLALPALRDPDEMVRATAAASVVFLPVPEAVDVLLPLLDDRYAFARREAAYALGEVGSSAATRRLLDTLRRDKDHEVRTAAAVALGKIGDPSAIAELAGILARRPDEESEFLRRAAARSIGQIAQIIATGNRRVVTPRDFFPDDSGTVSGGRPVPPLEDRSGFIEPARILARVLDDVKESADTRREAAYALGWTGDAATAALLRKYTTGPDPYLAEIAREALLKLPPPPTPAAPSN